MIVFLNARIGPVTIEIAVHMRDDLGRSRTWFRSSAIARGLTKATAAKHFFDDVRRIGLAPTASIFGAKDIDPRSVDEALGVLVGPTE